MLTGSGPTLFAIYASEGEAAAAATELESRRLSQLEGAAIIVTTTSTAGGSS